MTEVNQRCIMMQVSVYETINKQVSHGSPSYRCHASLSHK